MDKQKNTAAPAAQIRTLKKEISRLKLTEQALKKERDFISKVLYWIDSLVVVVDLNGYIVTFNKASEQFSGYGFEEIKDRPFWDTLLLPEERESVKTAIFDVITQGLPRNNQNYWLTKSGEKRFISWMNSILRKPDGSIEYILCTGQDITDRKKAEAALSKSEAKYRELVENANSIIIRLDTRGQFIFINEYAQQFFGYKEKDILGKNVLGTILPETDTFGGDLSSLIEDIVNNPELYKNFENENICKDGRRVWVTWTNKAIYDDQGKIKEILCIGNDNTERKRLELQLQRAHKMEAVGMLAGGVAHDLNNILSGIVSYPDLLLLDLPEESPLLQPITRIKESGQKAAAIVQDLLTLARRGVAVSKVVNLNDIINTFIKTPEFEKLQTDHLKVKFEIRLSQELLNILGSSVHLSKTVMNLVSNAYEATPEGGTITIATENRYIDRPIRGYEDVEEGDYVLISVSDTGTGISAEDLPRIFEPFFTKKIMGRSGTGLGMAVVWSTVKDHSGYIDVQSAPGEGTRCELYFPVTRKSKQSDKSSLSIGSYRGKEHILVIDDIEEQREIAMNMLSRLGYKVTALPSGEAAVEYLKNHAADLIVLDMIMDPGIDGLETYRRILKYHPKQKAIVTSGYSETERVSKTLTLGAGAYLKKPYVLTKIGPAIRAELDK